MSPDYMLVQTDLGLGHKIAIKFLTNRLGITYDMLRGGGFGRSRLYLTAFRYKENKFITVIRLHTFIYFHLY